MSLFSTTHTKDVANKLLKDLKRYLYIINLITHIFFIVFYGYEIYLNLHNYFLLSVNAICLLIAIVLLIVFLAPIFKTKEGKRTFKDVAKIIKISLGFATFVYNLVIYFIYDLGTVHLVLTVFSLIILLLNIAFTFTVKFTERYINNFAEAIREDYENSNFLGKKILDKTIISKVVNKKRDEK